MKKGTRSVAAGSLDRELEDGVLLHEVGLRRIDVGDDLHGVAGLGEDIQLDDADAEVDGADMII